MKMQNLPVFATTFIGRETELAEVEGLLQQPNCRLLTLVGPGGMGKTRLATEAASRQIAHFPNGVFFVPLQPLNIAEHITSAISEALDLQLEDVPDKSGEQQLFDYFKDKELLLILDNFEQVLAGADLITDLLNAAPQVKIIVTSRIALNIQREWVRPVLGMSFPDHLNGNDPEQYGAVQLFVERAQPVSSSFSPENDMPYIVQICQLAGGMPLGIELAAAWLRTLSCAEIAEEIQRSLDILESQKRDIPERHRSIRAVFDASWKMLTPQEQALFMRLSVFKGTPTREAIQHITGASLPMLSALVDKALLTRVEQNHYQMHELLNQYGEEKLNQSNLALEMRDAHSAYYLDFLRDRERDLWGYRQVEVLDEIEADFENIRAAWYWALERMDDTRIGAAVEPLCLFMWMGWSWIDGQPMLAEAMRRFEPKSDEKPLLVWGKLLSRFTKHAEDPLEQLNQAMAIARYYEDPVEIALCCLQLGYQYGYMNQPDRSKVYYTEALKYYRELGDPFHQAQMLDRLGSIHRLTGDYEKALAYTQEAIRITTDIGDAHVRGTAIGELGLLMFIQGNFAEAEQLYATAAQLARRSSFWLETWVQIESAGIFDLGLRGDVSQAHQKIEAALKLAESNIMLEPSQLLALVYKSLLAAIEEDYVTAQADNDTGMLMFFGDSWEPILRWGAMAAAAGLQDYDGLAILNNDLLQHFYKIRVNTWLLVGVAFAAILTTYRDNAPRRGAELLALACTHPQSLSGWLRVWPLIQRLTQYLEDTLGNTGFATAWERGKTLNLESVVEELLSQADGKTSGVTPAKNANLALIDPLSERELEVLGLIASGYSNRQIADHLVVGEATVKKHITHIYSKLDVDSRTRALVRARELQLV